MYLKAEKRHLKPATTKSHLEEQSTFSFSARRIHMNKWFAGLRYQFNNQRLLFPVLSVKLEVRS